MILTDTVLWFIIINHTSNQCIYQDHKNHLSYIEISCSLFPIILKIVIKISYVLFGFKIKIFMKCKTLGIAKYEELGCSFS